MRKELRGSVREGFPHGGSGGESPGTPQGERSGGLFEIKKPALWQAYPTPSRTEGE